MPALLRGLWGPASHGAMEDQAVLPAPACALGLCARVLATQGAGAAVASSPAPSQAPGRRWEEGRGVALRVREKLCWWPGEVWSKGFAECRGQQAEFVVCTAAAAGQRRLKGFQGAW